MSVFLTKSMLSKFNKDKYQDNTFDEFEENSSCNIEYWQQIVDSKDGVGGARAVCRACGGDAGCTPLSARLADVADTPDTAAATHADVAAALAAVADLDVSVSDALPQHICARCLHALTAALTFRRTAQLTDRTLRRALSPTGGRHRYPYSRSDFRAVLRGLRARRQRALDRDRDRGLQRATAAARQRPAQPATAATTALKCSACSLTFPDQEALEAHLGQAGQDGGGGGWCGRRACDVCGALVRSVTQHRRQAHGATTHQCPQCGKAFPVRARLTAHMRSHTDSFPFRCDLCAYRAKHKYYLVLHMRTHTGEKPYSCARCPATFVNPSNLNKHRLTHSPRAHRCPAPSCDKCFRTPAAARDHHNAAHLRLRHPCAHCPRHFCYKSDLRKHEIRVHGRSKRSYVGQEPAYRQQQRKQLENATTDATTNSAPAPAHYIQLVEPQTIYISELALHHVSLVPPQTVQLTIGGGGGDVAGGDAEEQKPAAHLYEPQSDIAYY